MWVHSSLFSHADQDGEFTAIVGDVLCADRDVVRDAKDPVAPAYRQGLSASPVPKMYPRRVEGLGENAAVGPPHCRETRS